MQGIELHEGGRQLEKVRYMISDAANLVDVESHVLRYWEDELGLLVPRNEMGHRYYTREHIQQFQKIKELKEKGVEIPEIRNKNIDIFHDVLDCGNIIFTIRPEGEQKFEISEHSFFKFCNLSLF